MRPRKAAAAGKKPFLFMCFQEKKESPFVCVAYILKKITPFEEYLLHAKVMMYERSPLLVLPISKT